METTKVWRFHYHLTMTSDPRNSHPGLLEAAKNQLRVVADELTPENFGEEELE